MLVRLMQMQMAVHPYGSGGSRGRSIKDSGFALILAALLEAPQGRKGVPPPRRAAPAEKKAGSTAAQPPQVKPGTGAKSKDVRGKYVSSGSDLAAMVDRVAEKYGLDPALLRAVVKVESDFNPLAVSHAGAMGLMQLMPGTAGELGVKNPFDPAENLEGGARYLKSMIERFGGDLKLALAAYNAGPGAVDRHGGVPPYGETISYIERIRRLYRGAFG